MKNYILIALIGICYHPAAQEPGPITWRENSDMPFESSTWEGIQLDATLTPEQQETIRGDLDNLCRLDYDFENEEVRGQLMPLFALFGIEELSCEALTNWLEERIGVITGHLSYIPPRHLWAQWRAKFIPMTFDAYTVQQFFGISENLRENPDPNNRLPAIFNLGPTMTIWTHQSPQHFVPWQPSFFLFDTDDGMEIPVEVTQRRGLLFVTETFFEPLSRVEIGESSIVKSLLRLGILFHEARHNDAYQPNGTFITTFNHTTCPNGTNNCDNSWDRSYGIQYAFLLFAAEACDQCDQQEIDALRAMANEIRVVNIAVPLSEVLSAPSPSF